MSSIPIPVRRGPRAAAVNADESAPSAPVIGSFKVPSHISDGIPDLSLPPQSPEAFSMVSSGRGLGRRLGVSRRRRRTLEPGTRGSFARFAARQGARACTRRHHVSTSDARAAEAAKGLNGRGRAGRGRRSCTRAAVERDPPPSC